MISILYQWRRTIVVLATVSAIAMLSHRCYTAGYESATKTWTSRWAKRDLEDAMAASQNAQRSRNREVQYQRKMSALINETTKKIELLQHDVDTAHAAANGLRAKVDKYVKQSNLSRTTGTALDCTASDREKIRVLAELFKRADERAGIMAEIADNARLRGLACESAYHNARNVGSPLSNPPQLSQ